MTGQPSGWGADFIHGRAVPLPPPNDAGAEAVHCCESRYRVYIKSSMYGINQSINQFIKNTHQTRMHQYTDKQNNGYTGTTGCHTQLR